MDNYKGAVGIDITSIYNCDKITVCYGLAL